MHVRVQHNPVPEALVRNVTRGYMASVSYVDSQVAVFLFSFFIGIYLY